MREKSAAAHSRSGNRFSSDAAYQAKPSVVAVSDLPIILVVVSRIAERAGLQALSLSPADAARRLAQLDRVVLVLDGGPDNCACDGLADAISAARTSSGSGWPKVILLSTSPQPTTASILQPLVDAVVAKPLTPERLQPLLTDLARPARHA